MGGRDSAEMLRHVSTSISTNSVLSSLKGFPEDRASSASQGYRENRNKPKALSVYTILPLGLLTSALISPPLYCLTITSTQHIPHPSLLGPKLIEPPDLRKQPNFLPRQMNLAEACSPSEINSLVRRGLL